MKIQLNHQEANGAAMHEVGDRAQSETAPERLVDLLRSDIWAEPGDAGYVDLLSNRQAIGSGASQWVLAGRMLAAVYERFFRPLLTWLVYEGKLSAAEEHQLTLDLLKIAPGETVLDVGCGTGEFTRSLAAVVGDGLAAGLDVSKTMLAVAVEEDGGENLAYLRADPCELPFGDGEFDAVCTVGRIHLLDDPFQSLAEIVRVTRPGGRIVIGSSWRKKPEGRWGGGGVGRFGRNELADALSDRGCVGISQRVYGKGQFVLAHKP